ncbi:MAG TPA: hypothetical protein VMW16_02065 [Sedimentisphaerales bacterium]|nr:hypothetical protein [Sedimentisphaerales bacterium]
MKAEHRHELKTNELAEWLAELPEWAKENAKAIIIVAVVAVLAVGSYFYFGYQKKLASDREQLRLTELLGRLVQTRADILNARAMRGVDYSYFLLQLADELKTFAQNAKSDERAAIALIERAKALRAELHYRPSAVGMQDVTAQIKLAKDSYNEALAKRSVSPSLAALAKLGLGLCEEELGNFEGAKQIYSDIVANPQFESTTAAVEAKQRLEAMDDYQKRVVFAPPKPAPAAPLNPPVPPTSPDVGPVLANVADANEAVGVDIKLPAVSPLDVNVAAP